MWSRLAAAVRRSGEAAAISSGSGRGITPIISHLAPNDPTPKSTYLVGPFASRFYELGPLSVLLSIGF